MADKSVGGATFEFRIRFENGLTFIGDWIEGKLIMGATKGGIHLPKIYTMKRLDCIHSKK